MDHKEQGITYYMDKKYDLAIEEFSKLILLDPNNPGSYGLRGFTYLDRGQANQNKSDYDLALADFNKSIELFPNAPSYFGRGKFYLYKEENDAAIIEYNNALVLDPNYIEAYLNRGLLYGAIGDVNNAIKDFKTILKIDPNNNAAKNMLNFIYQKLNGQTISSENDNERNIGAIVNNNNIYKTENKIQEKKHSKTTIFDRISWFYMDIFDFISDKIIIFSIIFYLSSIFLCSISFAIEETGVNNFSDIFTAECLVFIGIAALFLIISYVILNFVNSGGILTLFRLASTLVIAGLAFSRVIMAGDILSWLALITSIIGLILSYVKPLRDNL